jgi:HlyD family secretion protein
MPVLLEGWGGSEPIRAQVRVVEPYAVTKVSALGIEEKRVNIIADFVDPPGPLGDGFRVTARIITWSADSVLKVPTSALFRCGEEWCVFSIEGQRAMSRTVEIGHRNALEAEVVQGLDEGELVIRHPGNQIEEASRVTPR